jgi:hypothetical protein
MRKLTQKMTKAWLLTLTVSFLAGFGESNAEGFDPASEEYAVTAEMLDADHDDYDEGAVDLTLSIPGFHHAPRLRNS